MNTKQMIEVMQAFVDGKKIEYSIVGRNDWIRANCVPVWAWDRCEYRIAPEPKKEGRWERKEIQINDGDYVIIWSEEDWIHLGRADATPGFGGIDYRSPFDPKVIVRSVVPLMFDTNGAAMPVGSSGFDESCRPGIPVAAWFWREGEK